MDSKTPTFPLNDLKLFLSFTIEFITCRLKILKFVKESKINFRILSQMHLYETNLHQQSFEINANWIKIPVSEIIFYKFSQDVHLPFNV